MNWVPTNGRKPRTGDKPLRVRFRNGLESKVTYTAEQLRWSHKDNSDPWDVTHVARAEG